MTRVGAAPLASRAPAAAIAAEGFGAPRLSRAERRALSRSVRELHREVAAEISALQTELGRARAQGQSAPDAARALDELGHVGRALTALKEPRFFDQLAVLLQLGGGVSLVPGLAFAGGVGVIDIGAVSPETGKRSVGTDVGGIGAGPGMVLRKFARQAGVGFGVAPPFTYVAKDPLVGDTAGISIPGILLAGMFVRPNGAAGVELGLFPPTPIPGLTGQIVVGVQHPILRPVIAPLLGPVARFLGGLTSQGKKAWAGLCAALARVTSRARERDPAAAGGPQGA